MRTIWNLVPTEQGTVSNCLREVADKWGEARMLPTTVGNQPSGEDRVPTVPDRSGESRRISPVEAHGDLGKLKRATEAI